MVNRELIKVLLFNEAMDQIILKREETLAAFSGVRKSANIFQEVQRIMLPEIGVPETAQPYWWHLRTECFPHAETAVYVFFGQIAYSEMMRIEKSNGSTVVVSTDPAQLKSKSIVHRLRYLIPMAMVLSSIDSRQWPKP